VQVGETGGEFSVRPCESDIYLHFGIQIPRRSHDLGLESQSRLMRHENDMLMYRTTSVFEK